MISRIVQFTIDKRKINDFRASLNSDFLPRIQALPGFVDNIESLDASTGEFSCMTLWKSSDDVERYDKGLFQEVATALGPLMTNAPTIKTLPVENSSIHKVKAGRAAA